MGELERIEVDVLSGEVSTLPVDPEERGEPDALPVPSIVPLWRARAALGLRGLIAQADDIVVASGDPVLTEFWQYGNEISRTSPRLSLLADKLGLSEAQVDELFRAAAEIVV